MEKRRPNSCSSDPRREQLLREFQETLSYSIQEKVDDVWLPVESSIRGRKKAYSMLSDLTKDPENSERKFRVLSKNEADKYQEGLSAGASLYQDGFSDREPRRRWPLMALPEHL
jgi:hypothetical protein